MIIKRLTIKILNAIAKKMALKIGFYGPPLALLGLNSIKAWDASIIYYKKYKLKIHKKYFYFFYESALSNLMTFLSSYFNERSYLHGAATHI